MAINLGNIVNVGGKQVGSGIVSGFDTAALVESLTAAKRIPAVKLEESVETNATKISKFNELNTILGNLKTAANFLRNPTGINNVSQNIFQYRIASTTSNTSTTASNFLTASAAPGASKGTFDFAVGNVAKARTVRTDSFTSQTASVVKVAPGAGEFAAGTFDIAPVIATDAAATLNIAEIMQGTDYAVVGAPSGVLLATLGNFQVSGDGHTGLVGTITAVAGSYNSDPANDLTLSITLNGETYTSNVISTVGGTGQQIEAQTITFTNAETGTSFDITTATAYDIDNDVDNVNGFISELESDLGEQTITQQRNLSSFDDTQVRSPITGLTQADVIFTTDTYTSTGSIGNISGFTVNYSDGDNTISVDIDGVTYTATGLPNAVGNITLTSAGNKSLTLNFGTAGVMFDIDSDAAADELAASLDYALGTRELATISLAEGDSLIEIAASINAFSTTTGVTANIIQVSSTDYRLQMRANQVGVDHSFAVIDDDGIWDNVLDGGNFDYDQAAEDAVIAIDGIVTTRSTNTITDLITGLTLNITQKTDSFSDQGEFNALGSPQLVTVNITDDKETVKTAITNFVDAYNAYRVFVAQQTSRDEKGNLIEGAVLNTNTSLNVLVNQLGTEAVRSVPGVSDATMAALSNIGISVVNYEGDDETIEVKSILQFDEARLDEALANGFSGIKEIFSTTFTATSSNLSLFNTSNASSLTDFKVKVVDATTVEIYDLNDQLLFNMDRSGSTLTGQEGTALEGTKLIYSGAGGGDTITVHLTQGIGERFFNILKPFLDDEGTLDQQINAINDNTDRLETEIEKIDRQIELYRSQILAQFANLEEAVGRINSLLDFLDANSKSVFDD